MKRAIQKFVSRLHFITCIFVLLLRLTNINLFSPLKYSPSYRFNISSLFFFFFFLFFSLIVFDAVYPICCVYECVLFSHFLGWQRKHSNAHYTNFGFFLFCCCCYCEPIFFSHFVVGFTEHFAFNSVCVCVFVYAMCAPNAVCLFSFPIW